MVDALWLRGVEFLVASALAAGKSEMKLYLINLAEAADRLETQTAQFGGLGLSFERFEACRDDERAVNRFRWWCAVLRPRVRGEVGCARSHAAIYEKIAAGREPCAAVFEDDIICSAALPQALAAAERKCLEDPRAVVLTGDHRRCVRGEPIADGTTEVRIGPTDWDFCTEGYVIGREAAAALAQAQRRICVPADSWGRFHKKGFVRLYRVVPPVCCQDPQFASSIAKRYVVAEHGVMERAWWRMRRIVGIALDTLMDGGRWGW